MNSETALITGSSSGIGLHLAHEFASHAHPLVPVAPVESEHRVDQLLAIYEQLVERRETEGTSAFQRPYGLDRASPTM
jgi:NAD(P)-dependent dehydrogenase (short-subunit alcohol dehydrogenase family)